METKVFGSKRSVAKVIILTLVTLGIYGIYWYYKVLSEIKEHTGRDYSPWLRLVMLFIPFLNFYVIYKIPADMNEHFKEEGSKQSLSLYSA